VINDLQVDTKTNPQPAPKLPQQTLLLFITPVAGLQPFIVVHLSLSLSALMFSV